MNAKEKETNPNRQREEETAIFPMIGFDSATSSFPALLIKKPYRKELKMAKSKIFHFCRKVQNYFLSPKFCAITHLRDLKGFVDQ